MEKETLALEMLKELKHNARRWFIIAIIELILLLGTNIGWMVYESQWETITDEQVIEDIDNSTNSNFTQTIN